MKIQYRVFIGVVFLSILFLFGLNASKNVFAGNQSTYIMTFQNNGDAQSYVDYIIFEDTTSPYGGNYNNGDNLLIAPGGNTDLSVPNADVNVPGYSSKNVYHTESGLPAQSSYIEFLPWKYEDAVLEDVDCKDPVFDLSDKIPEVFDANHIHVTFIATLIYSCFTPSQPPPDPAPQQPTRNNPPSQGCSGGSSTMPDATFTWNTATYATQYKIYVYDGSSWLTSPNSGWQSGTSYTWNDVASSSSGVTWTVEARNANGYTSGIYSWDGFTAENCNSPPPTPASVSYSNPNCANAKYGGSANWSASSGATSYTALLRQGSTVIDTINTGGTSATFSSTSSHMNPGTTYNWRVQAHNAAGSSGWRTSSYFSVDNCPLPDLVGRIICPGAVNLNQSFECYGSFINQGTTAAPSESSFNNSFFVNGAWQTPHKLYSGVIGAGVGVSLDWDTRSFSFGTIGPKDFEYCADQNFVHLGTVTEASESNNCVNFIVQVYDSRVPPCYLSEGGAGDVSGDNKVWGDDLTFILDYVLGRRSLDSNQIARGDVTGDGLVNTSDAQFILQYLTPGERDSFPVCVPDSPPNLSVTLGCSAGTPAITFRWDDVDSEEGYLLAVSTNSMFSGYGSKTLSANTTQFIWPTNGTLSGSPSSPANDTTYYWGVLATSSAGNSSLSIPSPSSFVSPQCNPPPPANTTNPPSMWCSGALPVVNFSWSQVSGVDGYYLDVNYNNTWTGGGAQWGYGIITPNTTTQLVWDSSAALFGDPPRTPRNVTTYYWRMSSYNSFASGSHSTVKSFTTPDCSPPAPPGNLSVGEVCSAGIPTITFGWDDLTNETSYTIHISTSNVYSPYGQETEAANDTSFVWSSSDLVDSGDVDTVAGTQRAPENIKTYYWRIYATNANGSGNYAYGPAITTDCPPPLPNLVVSTFTMPDGDIGASVNASVTVQNTGDATTGARFEVGVHIRSGSFSCSTDGPPLPADVFVTTTTSLGVGASRAVNIPVILSGPPQSNITAVAMADTDCEIDEGASESDNTRIATYTAYGFDLSVSITSFDKNPANYDANELATATLEITNSPSANKASDAVIVGLWPYVPYSGYDYPSYPTSGSAPVEINVPAISPNSSTTVNGQFAVGDYPGQFTAHAFVIPTFSPVDYDWSNNGTLASGGSSYNVIVKSWFEGVGGDIGALGNISLSQIPPDPEVVPFTNLQSNYLAAAGGSITNVNASWKLSPYNKSQTASAYPYLDENKLSNLVSSQAPDCDLSTINEGSFYCDGSVSIESSPVVTIGASDVTYWFILGNLTINADITIPTDKALTLIVGGDVFVNTGVTQIDAIIVTNGTFHAQTSDTDVGGAQLVINGAVYAENMDLKRILWGGPAICGLYCDNTQYPAIRFIFDPKYLILLNEPLGSPSIDWTEVVP